ncbi:MAG: YbaB/EbfC family nucleoid-associated protein [Myxococcota bacterium]
MNDPFGGMGGLLGGLQAQMKALQAEAEKTEVEGVAGGLVTVRMNGAQEVLSVRIDPKAQADRELLEDLVRAATNDAVRRSKEAVAQKLAAFAQSMGLPPGLLGG